MHLNPENVLEAARRRVALVFDHFERVVVSASGGKDSTVLYWLAVEEAGRRGRKVEVFFLDQEAEYQATIDQVDGMMRHPAVIPVWLQVPIRMTNATSHAAPWLHAWEPGATWIRPKSDIAIHALDGCPDRFYEVFPWLERQAKVPTAHLVGLRSRESLNRWRAVKNNPGWQDIGWSTRCAGADSYRFYPVFDWDTGDVWKFIADSGVPYNRIYDLVYALRGQNRRTMRVSCLVHEQSFRALATLQELEPETYARLLDRLGGVHAAAHFAEDHYLFSADRLPAAFATWKTYRDYLIDTTPSAFTDHFRRRFARQPDDEATCREQVRQILINDWEDNTPVKRPKASRLREAWWDRL